MVSIFLLFPRFKLKGTYPVYFLRKIFRNCLWYAFMVEGTFGRHIIRVLETLWKKLDLLPQGIPYSLSISHVVSKMVVTLRMWILQAPQAWELWKKRWTYLAWNIFSFLDYVCAKILLPPLRLLWNLVNLQILLVYPAIPHRWFSPSQSPASIPLREIQNILWRPFS